MYISLQILLEGKFLQLNTVQPVILSLPSTRLSIKDKNGRPMIIVIPDLPADLKLRALTYLKCAFPGRLNTIDTQSKAQDYMFESIYFCWYNRYAKRVRLFLNYFFCFYS